MDSEKVEKEYRLMHIRIPFETYQKVRIKCALKSTSMQEYVSSLIESDLGHLNLSALKNQIG